ARRPTASPAACGPGPRRGRGRRAPAPLRGPPRAASTLPARPEGVPGEGAEGREAVLQADLLALGLRASVVRDRHLEDAEAPAGDLDRDLGVHAEPLGLEVERRDDAPVARLVAGRH